MAKILGQDGSVGWTPINATDQTFSAGAFGFSAGYNPLFDGNITSFNLQCGTGSSAGTFQIALYLGASPSTGGATLLAVSSPGTVVASTLVNVAVASTPVLAANVYTMFISTSSGTINTVINSGSSAFVDSQYNTTHFPFASPPGTTFNPRDAGTGHEPLLWADGTAAGGGPNYSLTIQPVGFNVSLADSIAALNLDIGMVSYGIQTQRITLTGPNGPDGGGGKQRWRRKLTSIR